eukprot:TRINITY_DN4455_c0_g2_i1.p1 TRINITY_DN4455_c0_g2~~TRINITY_DN4455_c0_g2_i1.p1  ORF type:complete len:1169 (+),score=436.70 TRINITY_DN4455_c0_g2_i1:86-3508(+)
MSPGTPQRGGNTRPRTPTARSARVASGTPQSARRRGERRNPDDSGPLTPTSSHRRGGGGGGGAGGAENIVAAVRVRSFLPRELERGDELCTRMRNQTCEITVPSKGRLPFTFDHCFWSVKDFEGIDELPFAGQREVYETLGKPVVDNALAGFNAAVIAYGQTGSGKSYSIFGPPDSLGGELEGLIPRMCKALFERVSEAKQGTTFKLAASMIEIYMEKVYDLLNNRNQLTLRGDLQRGFTVPGRSRRDVRTYANIEELLQCGEMKRTVAQTALNERSSRAHTLFELEIRQITESRTTTSKLTLCDLAGSERCKDAKTEVGGKEFNQACQINMSLLCLGKCVESVVQRGSDSLVTEFRNSTLTKLLKDSIGGNSKTVILTTISPSAADVHTTLQALRFADRAKQIQLHAVINDDALWEAKNRARLVQRFYQQRIDALNKEYELEKQAADLTEQQLQLESEMVRVQAERDALQAQKQQMMRSRAMSEAERRQFEKREAELQARLVDVGREHEQLQSRMDELESQNAKHYAEGQAVKREKEELEEEMCFLQGKGEMMRKQLEDQTLAWEEEKAEIAKSHRLELENVNNVHTIAMERKEDRFLEERKQYVEQMMEAVAKLQKDMQHKEERWAEKEEKWKKQLVQKETENGSLRADMQQMRVKVEDGGAAAQRAEHEASRVAALSDELLAKTREADELEDQLTTAKWGQEEASQRIAALHKELSSASAKLADMQQDLRTASLSLAEVRAAAGVCQPVDSDEDLRLTEQLAALVGALTEVKKREVSTKSELRRKHRDEVEKLESKLGGVNAELAAAKEAFVRGDSDLRQQITDLGGEVRRLGLELKTQRRQHGEQIAEVEERRRSAAESEEGVRERAHARERELDEELRTARAEMRSMEHRWRQEQQESARAADDSELEKKHLEDELALQTRRNTDLRKEMESAEQRHKAELEDAQARLSRAHSMRESSLASLRRDMDEERAGAIADVKRRTEREVERMRTEHAAALESAQEKAREELDRVARRLDDARRQSESYEEELQTLQESGNRSVKSLLQTFRKEIQGMEERMQAVGERAWRGTAESQRRVNASFSSSAGSDTERKVLSPSQGNRSPSAQRLTPPRKTRQRQSEAVHDDPVDKENRMPGAE